jgi:hypothetical protein
VDTQILAGLADLIQTNIRVPLVWLDAIQEGILQGTFGWDASIASRYSRSAHPAFNLMNGGYTDFQLMSNLILYTNSEPPLDPCDTDRARQILVRDFSHLKESVQEEGLDCQEKMELDTKWLKPGVTGVDFGLPLFDGQSTNPADHIIDLDTDSMERCADVRVYFWSVGDQLQCERQAELDEPDIEPPSDPELRLEYDDKLVKEGRQYLKEAKLKKEG